MNAEGIAELAMAELQGALEDPALNSMNSC
jgi:hypothetical protein